MEWELAVKTNVRRKACPSAYFSHYTSHTGYPDYQGLHSTIPQGYNPRQCQRTRGTSWIKIFDNTCRSSVMLVARRHFVFEVHPSPLDFLSMGYFKTTVHSAPFENEQTLQKRNFCVCQTIRNRPGICERLCDSSWLYASPLALLQAEDILSIGCELWLENPYKLNSN